MLGRLLKNLNSHRYMRIQVHEVIWNENRSYKFMNIVLPIVKCY